MKNATITTWGIAVALTLQFLGATIYFILFADSSFARIAYGGTKALMVVLPLLLIALGTPIRIPKFEWPSSSSIGRGLALGAISAAAMFFVALTWPHILTQATNAIAERAETFGLLTWFVTFALLFSLIHSLFEEYYWRWFVLSGLRTRCTTTQAAVIGSIGFASHHFIILSAFFPPLITLLFGAFVFLAGVAWSLLAKNTQGLWSAWVSHAIIDGAIFGIAWMFLHAT